MLAGIAFNGWPRKGHIVIVVSNRIHVTKGHEKEFEECFQARVGLVEKMPGFICLEILRPIKSDYYIVQTCWENMDAFRNWTDSPEFHEAHWDRPHVDIFSGPNVLETNEVIQLCSSPRLAYILPC